MSDLQKWIFLSYNCQDEDKRALTGRKKFFVFVPKNKTQPTLNKLCQFHPKLKATKVYPAYIAVKFDPENTKHTTTWSFSPLVHMGKPVASDFFDDKLLSKYSNKTNKLVTPVKDKESSRPTKKQKTGQSCNRELNKVESKAKAYHTKKSAHEAKQKDLNDLGDDVTKARKALEAAEKKFEKAADKESDLFDNLCVAEDELADAILEAELAGATQKEIKDRQKKGKENAS